MKQQYSAVVFLPTTSILCQEAVMVISMSGMLSLAMEKLCTVFPNVMTLGSHVVIFLQPMDLAVSVVTWS